MNITKIILSRRRSLELILPTYIIEAPEVLAIDFFLFVSLLLLQSFNFFFLILWLSLVMGGFTRDFWTVLKLIENFENLLINIWIVTYFSGLSWSYGSSIPELEDGSICTVNK
jgi:hypothetical protein